MIYKNILRIVIKETHTLLRNKRVLIGLFAPLVFLPLLLIGYEAFSQMTQETTELTKSIIVVEGTLPSSLEELIVEDGLITLKPKESTEEPDLILRYSFINEQHLFTLVYDYARGAANRASERIKTHIEAFRELEREKLLGSVGLTPKDIEFLIYEVSDLATEEQAAGKSLSNMLPLILVLYTMLSIINFAIELTTTEKESQTLETMFSVPVTRFELVLGKLLSCIFFSVVSTLIVLVGMYVLMPLIMDIGALSLVMTPMLLIHVFITLIPLLLIGSGLSIATGMFASSYKEAGAYSTPLVFVFMLPAYLGSTPGLISSPFTSVIPILNATLLIKSALLGQLDYGHLGIAFISNSLFSVLSLAFMFKVFTTEKILFGSGKDFSFKLKRKLIPTRLFLESQDVLLSVAVTVIVFINSSLMLPKIFNYVPVFFFSQYGALLGIPLVITWYLKADLKSTFGLHVPRAKGLLAGFFFWVSAFSAAIVYQLVIAPYVDQAPTLVGLEEQISGWSVAMQFFFIAVTPGLCEEMLFRGFALNPLKRHWGSKSALIVSALMFAMVHLDVVRLVPTFMLGLAFGYIALATGSIIPAIALHIMNNALALFMPETVVLEFWPMLMTGLVAFTVGLYLHYSGKIKKSDS
jgi:sodium transport system permease protein